jgi:hypothetical protein
VVDSQALEGESPFAPVLSDRRPSLRSGGSRYERMLSRRRGSSPGTKARESILFFTPPEVLALTREAGFREVEHVSAANLAQRYFANRTDGLRPPNNSEEFLVAKA